MEHKNAEIYRTAIYLRLSKEDSYTLQQTNKFESESIINQKAYILDYLKSKPELKLCGIYIDDGYSGVNFERPEFQNMLEAIKNGVINCVVVKDLSRFGRNYIETGRYIERIFPLLGVRFISINDYYDSSKEQENLQTIILPFKNLINDAYCRDISIKIRSHLDIKRKKGEFIGAFTVYGYKKSENNKNQLVIDNYAAKNVKYIFKLRFMGLSNQRIAEKLNSMGILSPLEYKKQEGILYSTVFQIYAQAKWSASTVGRVLKNEIYTGTLIQGKESTPNYKIKKSIRKEEGEWIRIENAHEPIISKAEFNTMQHLLRIDTRSQNKVEKAAPFSGYIRCADCKSNMVRKSVTRKAEADETKKKYSYYICSGNKKDKKYCSAHRVREDTLIEAITYMFQKSLNCYFNSEIALALIKYTIQSQNIIGSMEERIEKLERDIERYTNLKINLYEDVRKGILSEEEYRQFKFKFEQKVNEAKRSIQQLKQENYQDQNSIMRFLVVYLISAVYIFENHRIIIEFRYKDKL